MISEEELSRIKEEAFYLKQNFYQLSDDNVQGQDIDKVFKRYKKAQRNFELMSDRLLLCKKDLDQVEMDLQELKSSNLNDKELQDIESRNHIVKREKLIYKSSGGGVGNKNEKATPYRTFKVSGTEIYVGKDAKNNDILTKGLKSNDYWFHVVSGGGSHIAVKNKKEDLKPGIIRASCILALFFSGSHPRSGSVYFCQKMNLKNTPTVGLWKVLRSKVIDLSYTDEELNDILAGEIR